MNPTICQAINERRLLRILYDPGSRIIEPHAHGMGTAGNELLRAYQVSGASASGNPIDWKLIRTDRISYIKLLYDKFPGPRPGYRKRDSAMTQIYCQL